MKRDGTEGRQFSIVSLSVSRYDGAVIFRKRNQDWNRVGGFLKEGGKKAGS
jgi:hypothetical protein